MANTYTQLYFHVVCVVKRRENLIAKKWEDDLYKYLTGVVTGKDQKLICVNGIPDHIHILIGTKPTCNLSDLIRDVKANTSRWINENKLTPKKFEWQKGFGAFTVSQSQVSVVINYIKKQEEHHQVKTFRQEYIEFLKAYQIDYKDEYLFDDIL